MATKKRTPTRPRRVTITMPAALRQRAEAQAEAWRPDEKRVLSAWLCELVRRHDRMGGVDRLSDEERDKRDPMRRVLGSSAAGAP